MHVPGVWPKPKLTLDQTLWECFRHFAAMDEANAAVHTNIVRWSPITFRLAEHLAPILEQDFLAWASRALLVRVVDDLGTYAEDAGR